MKTLTEHVLAAHNAKTFKPLKASNVKLLAKLESFGVVVTESAPASRLNMVSGVSITLTPEACALFDFIMGSYRNYLATRGTFSYNVKTFPVSIWDRTRYLFLELWPDAYYDLID